VGDLTDCPDLIRAKFDVITAFRFFLNTEDEVRHRAIMALSGLLKDKDSRLVFNMHGNSWSYLGLLNKILQWRGRAWHTTMSPLDVWRLVKLGNLEVEEWHGFGVLPRYLYRTPLRPLVSRFEQLARRVSLLKWISRDMLVVCRPSPPHGACRGGIRRRTRPIE